MRLKTVFEKVLIQLAAACGARKFVLNWVRQLISDLESAPQKSLAELAPSGCLDLTRRTAKFGVLLVVSVIFVTAYVLLIGRLGLGTGGNIGLAVPFIGAPLVILLLLLFEKGVQVRDDSISFKSVIGSGSEIALSRVEHICFEIRSSTGQKVPEPKVAVQFSGQDLEMTATGLDRGALVTLASRFAPEQRSIENTIDFGAGA